MILAKNEIFVDPLLLLEFYWFYGVNPINYRKIKARKLKVRLASSNPLNKFYRTEKEPLNFQHYSLLKIGWIWKIMD